MPSTSALPNLLGSLSRQQQHTGQKRGGPSRPPVPPLKLAGYSGQTEAESELCCLGGSMSTTMLAATSEKTRMRTWQPMERLKFTASTAWPSEHVGEVSSAPCSVRRSSSSAETSNISLSERGSRLTKQGSRCTSKLADSKHKETNASCRRSSSMSSVGLQSSSLSSVRPVRRSSSSASMRHRTAIADSRPSSASMRHRTAIAESRSSTGLSSVAEKSQEPRDVALLRMVMAEAKRRHVHRPAFQKRLEEQQDSEGEGQLKEPTLWRLHQASGILREAVQDVVGALKACTTAVDSVHLLQKLAEERKATEAQNNEAMAKTKTCQQRMQRQLPKLIAMNAFGKQLVDMRTAESEWSGLASTIAKTPPSNKFLQQDGYIFDAWAAEELPN